VSMGLEGFGPVSAGDGSPQLRHVLAHAITTILLLITLVAAGWQFVASVDEPSACLADSSRPSTCPHER
jgi:hypothetical protein